MKRIKIASDKIRALAEGTAKGDYIPPETIEKLTHSTRTDRNYALTVLDFKTTIERELFAAGKTWTLKCEKDGLRVLDDTEASEYNNGQFSQHIRGMGRAHFRMMGVDRAELAKEAQSRHDHNVLRQSMRLQAVNAFERKQVTVGES
jgi:hypothetical protein